MNETRAALLKTVAFSIVPVILFVIGPWAVLVVMGHTHRPHLDVAGAVGVVLIVAGFTVFLQSIWGFIYVGRGTPAPLAPPRVLVIDGPYRYVRNPMYLAGFVVLLGEALAFDAWELVGYAACFFAACHLVTVRVEEPRLRARFGESFREYCEAVPRWIPKLGALKSMR